MSPLDTNDVKVIIHEQIQEYLESQCKSKHLEVQLEMGEIKRSHDKLIGLLVKIWISVTGVIVAGFASMAWFIITHRI